MNTMANTDSKCIEETTELHNYTKCADIFKENSTDRLLYVCHFCSGSFFEAQPLEEHIYEHFDDVTDPIKSEQSPIEFEFGAYDEPQLNNDDESTEDHQSVEISEYPDDEFVIENLDDDSNVEHFDIVFSNDENNEDRAHVMIESPLKSQLRCSCCFLSRPFPCFGLLQNHIDQRGVGTHSCPNAPDCMAKFHTIAEVDAHSILHDNADMHLCIHCGKAYSSEIEVNLHYGMRVDTVDTFVKEKLRTDSLVAKENAIVAKELRVAPLKVDPNEQIFICDVCSKMFEHYSEIKQHMKEFHGADRIRESQRSLDSKKSSAASGSVKNPLQCGRAAIKKDTNGLFICTYCEKTFRTRENFVQHERIHTGEKPYECVECGKRFNHSSYINIHMRTHSGIRPYQCTKCDSAFISRSKLTTHVRKTHQKIRAHVCSVCEKKFAAPANLRDHFRAEHTMDRPFECGQCGKSFAKVKLLRQHQQLHQKDKQYECRFCPLKFAQAAGKHGHERRIHSMELAESRLLDVE